MTSKFDDQNWYLYLGLASALVSTFITVIIWQTKELQVHPMRLFMYIIVAESMLSFIDDGTHLICDLKLQRLFAYTVYFSGSYPDRVHALKVLTQSSALIACFCVYRQLCLNLSLCIDLVYMIKRPFQDAKSRMPIYVITSTVISVFLAWLVT